MDSTVASEVQDSPGFRIFQRLPTPSRPHSQHVHHQCGKNCLEELEGSQKPIVDEKKYVGCQHALFNRCACFMQSRFQLKSALFPLKVGDFAKFWNFLLD